MAAGKNVLMWIVGLVFALVTVAGCGAYVDLADENAETAGSGAIDDHDHGDNIVSVTEALTAVGNGFYFPVDGSISGNGNWLACGASYYANVRHIGTDIIRPQGTAVFAVSSGTVIARSGPAQSSGWGNGLYALAIRHESNVGSFVAVYGHINTTLNTGATVTAGQQIGTIGDYYEDRSTGRWDGTDHLHFGVRPGTTIPASGWGRIADNGCANPSNVNGFVAPITYITTNAPAGFTSIAVGSSANGSVSAGGQKKYSFSMTSGQRYTVKLTPSSGDPDLYTSNNSAISTSNYQCRPYLGSMQVETCAFTAPWTGTNYILINGYTASSYALNVTSP